MRSRVTTAIRRHQVAHPFPTMRESYPVDCHRRGYMFARALLALSTKVLNSLMPDDALRQWCIPMPSVINRTDNEYIYGCIRNTVVARHRLVVFRQLDAHLPVSKGRMSIHDLNARDKCKNKPKRNKQIQKDKLKGKYKTKTKHEI